MAFVNGFGDFRDETRYRNGTSSREDSTLAGHDAPMSPTRTYMNRHSLQPPSNNNDPRAAMHRRFTTNALPSLSPIGQQRRQAAETSDYNSAAYHRVQLLEKKKMEYEYLKEKRRNFESQMEFMDAQARQDKDEMQRLANELGRLTNSGHQSEPTTPPELRDASLPSTMPRTNRYSNTSLTSPLGLSDRASRSGSQLTSPPDELVRQYSQHQASQMSSHSLSVSRRNFEKDPESFLSGLTTGGNRSAVTLNRNSMPATTQDVRGRPDLSESDLIGNLDRSFFLDDDEPKPSKRQTLPATTPDYKSFLHVDTADDKVPILVRRDGDGSMRLSSASGGAESATPQSPSPEQSQLSSGWPSQSSNRSVHHRYSLNGAPSSGSIGDGYNSPQSLSGTQTPTKPMGSHRHSIEAGFSSANSKRLGMIGSPSSVNANAPPKLLSSYSTNDIPTMKSTSNLAPSGAPQGTSANSHAEQHLHNHNLNLGRIPPGAVPNRLSQEMSGGNGVSDDDGSMKQSQSNLQANATPFGPAMAASASQGSHQGTSAYSSPPSQYSTPQLFGNYGANMLSVPMGQMQLGGPTQWGAQMNMYQSPFGGYNPYQQLSSGRDSQARVIQQRRMLNGEDNARFHNVRLEDLQGEIYGLCKDQHGCRFLQKQLEAGDPEHVRLIFEETQGNVVDLMIDPFGNYLCQKLFEHANEAQRTVLIRNASQAMVSIALNQHGTRALQKMIEHIATTEQVQVITEALRNQVVQLIQDLNGNHVVQKCLNHLSPNDSDFIFKAVAGNCVQVGTHRHGCCVLQRCIDHASGQQKTDLVSAITEHAHTLVQDPFGNYVVQYILDQDDMRFSTPLCTRFLGRVPALSRQKFSSNVIEKCIRVSDLNTRRLLIEELLEPHELERLIRDSFANYVIQTAMDFADPDTKARLIDAIRPILPQIRNTPYGRRIQGKIQERDHQMSSGAKDHSVAPGNTSSSQVLIGGQTPGYGGYVPPTNGVYQSNMPGDNGRGYGGPQHHGYQNPQMGNTAFGGHPPMFGSTRVSRQSTLNY